MAPPQSDPKRRRVLSDIVNTTPTMIESARRKSLGFDLVRIDHGLGSSIPIPPPDSTKLINQKAEQNRVGSAIPSIAKSQMYHKYLQVSRSLSEKCKVNSASLDLPFDDRPNVESLQSLEALKLEQARLDRALEEAARVLDALKDDSKDLERTHKRLKRQASEKETLIRLLAGNFETKEQKVQAAVAHEAQMTDLRLREHQNKLLNDYNDAKFKLEAKVAQNAQYEDSELIATIKELENNKLELETELQTVIAKKEVSIQQEMQLIDTEIDKTLQQKTAEVEEASNEFQQLQLALDQVSAQYEALAQELRQKQNTETELELQVKLMHEQIGGLGEVRMELKREIALINSDLLAVQGEELEWQQRVQHERQAFLSVQKKFHNYSATRRYLDHAIMSYSDKTRRYVRVENSVADVHDNVVVLNGTHYGFEKAGALENDAEYALEWELLVRDVLRKSDVLIIFCGSDKKPSMHYLLPAFTFLNKAQENHKDWSFEVYLQSLFFDGEEVFDILNASTDSAIEYPQNKLFVVSQRMLVHAERDLAMALKNEGDIDKTVLHILTINGSNKKTNQKCSNHLSIVNISNLEIDAQVEALQNAQTNIGKMVNYMLSTTNSVCACDIVPDPSQNLNSILLAVEALRQ